MYHVSEKLALELFIIPSSFEITLLFPIIILIF